MHPLKTNLTGRSRVKGARSHVKGLIKQHGPRNPSTSSCYSIHNAWPAIKDHHSWEEQTRSSTPVIPGHESSNLYFRLCVVRAKPPHRPWPAIKDSFLSIFFNLSFKYLINLSCGQFFCLLCDGFDVRTTWIPGVLFYRQRAVHSQCITLPSIVLQVLVFDHKLLLILETGNISWIRN